MIVNYDCAIVGGGPAGLNAALVLGRARQNVALFDNGQPRNAVTQESHGYLTRDGVTPAEFRRIAYEEVLKYPSAKHWPEEVTDIRKSEQGFVLTVGAGEQVQARKLILSAGLKEKLPDIEGLRDFYGRSVFNCPFCDGWELRDQPLAIISDHPAALHKTKLLLHWTRDLVVCTNGGDNLTAEQEEQLASRGIGLVKTPIAALEGRNGKLELIRFTDGKEILRSGGFIDPIQLPYVNFEDSLGYRTARHGGIVADEMGRTSVPGLFAAGDAAYVMPSQLIYAAASGSKAAMSVMAELTEENWNNQ
ncbi:NAD(P)/FAD-dependent oxidoreductase [Cohnella sp. AR92]|uniref:NAD(P)/FAD-dependent oxidoreductase n=1 Tax=Cohnella sp. AR92 TaxID=648716 RepID=UPI000F8D4491|nr:NAD(P)/FAD-dependent oxidoreductase [Cohnella sp. AR92]RUS46902.1 NAD(P)/FAD-dependent oxidoreductase [Cohnella sp. AR92]